MRFELSSTVEPRYSEDLGTMKITLTYTGFSLYQGKKTKKYKELGQQNYLVIRGFCYIFDLFITRFHCIKDNKEY